MSVSEVNLWLLAIASMACAAIVFTCSRREPWLWMSSAMGLLGVVIPLFVYASEGLRTAHTIAVLLVLAALAMLNVLSSRQLREYREAMHALSVREKRLVQAAEIAKLGYYYYDTVAERIVDCTDQHVRNHGRSREEYLELSSTLSNDQPLIHPDDRENMKRMYEKLLTGEQVEFTYRVPTDGRTIHLKEVSQPVCDDAGVVIGELGMTMDITEQVETAQELLVAQKLATTGRMAVGVAHDMNNHLAVILGNLELIAIKSNDPALKRHIDAALQAIHRGKKLSDNLLGFARRSKMTSTDFDLNEVLGETREWGGRTIPSNIAIETTLGEDTWKVRADPGLTMNAILNLIVNARDAMPDGGTLSLATGNVRLDGAGGDGADPDLAPGDYVRLSVADTGSGIEASILDHIFDPFFSTKTPTGGSGLGLSQVMGFMQQSGGTITVQSEIGEGTTFELYFPAATGEPAMPARAITDRPLAPSADAAASKRLSRVLLVDNDDELRAVLRQVLIDADFAVIDAPSGDGAFEWYLKNRDADVLVTDVHMEGTRDGPRLARDLREMAPHLPVIFLSGYLDDADVEAYQLQTDVTRMQKPFPNAELVEQVTRSLEGAGRSPQAPAPGD